MRVEGLSMIYLDDHENFSWQTDMRMIVRKNSCSPSAIAIEMRNNSTSESGAEDEDQFYVQCTPAEARGIAASLIFAAETAEKKQGETHAEAE